MTKRRMSPAPLQGDRRCHPASLSQLNPCEQLIDRERMRRALGAQEIDLVEEELQRRRK
jgi:hypothetical protein